MGKAAGTWLKPAKCWASLRLLYGRAEFNSALHPGLPFFPTQRDSLITRQVSSFQPWIMEHFLKEAACAQQMGKKSYPSSRLAAPDQLNSDIPCGRPSTVDPTLTTGYIIIITHNYMVNVFLNFNLCFFSSRLTNFSSMLNLKSLHW